MSLWTVSHLMLKLITGRITDTELVSFTTAFVLRMIVEVQVGSMFKIEEIQEVDMGGQEHRSCFGIVKGASFAMLQTMQ